MSKGPSQSQSPRPVSASLLAKEAKEFFRGSPGAQVRGPFGPVLQALLAALLPQLMEFLVSRFDITPKPAAVKAATPDTEPETSPAPEA